jgi:uncharacterized protein (TIGR00369 family)
MENDCMNATEAPNGEPVAGRWPGRCFACSNPAGLNLRFWHTEEGAMTRCRIPADYCGFDGLVHGGIIATLLDETSCWALFARLGRLGVTREMTTRFLRPVAVDSDLVVTGRVLEHDQRGAVVTVSLCDAAGALLAEGESSWSFPRLSRIAHLAEVPEKTLERFLADCRPTAATS